jgi:hypothetical protein
MHHADLFIAKSVANRPKDGPFLDTMIEHGLVKRDSVLHLSSKVPGLKPEEIHNLKTAIAGRFHRIDLLRSGGRKNESAPIQKSIHQAELNASGNANRCYFLQVQAADNGHLQETIMVQDKTTISVREDCLPVTPTPDRKRLLIHGKRLVAPIYMDTRRVSFHDEGIKVQGVLAPRLQPDKATRTLAKDTTGEILNQIMGGRKRGLDI